MAGGEVTLVELTKGFDDVVAVDAISLHVDSGEFFSLLGPSGCGKTTTLRMIAGFEQPTSGQILLDGTDVAGIPPYKRNVNTVFQSYALFPHLRVFDNVAFGLRRAGVAKDEIRRRVADVLALVELTGLERRKPSQLSGGQQQRVALARVLVLQPAVVLLDEPLGALDAKIRRSLQVELKALQERVGLTFIYVTHDQEEALTMSDRLAVMNRGRVEQLGPPKTVYEEPQTTFVADFLGISNLLRGSALGRDGERCRIRVGEFELHAGRGDLDAAGETKLVIRPERVRLEPSTSTGENRIPSMVERIVYRGSNSQVFTRLPNGDQIQALIQNAGEETQFASGDAVRLYLPPDALRVLADTGTVPQDDNKRIEAGAVAGTGVTT
ncbi:MAG TPA: ABC transporter ATP-binding protein [Solirubrobacteraceae bacterium]|nr:ABC transporter ATP-binding protein [Solirubrobacteraceae bacterium]